MTPKKEVHVYFPPKIFDRLKEMAERNRRSMNAEVIIAVESRIETEARQYDKKEEVKK